MVGTSCARPVLTYSVKVCIDGPLMQCFSRGSRQGCIVGGVVLRSSSVGPSWPPHTSTGFAVRMFWTARINDCAEHRCMLRTARRHCRRTIVCEQTVLSCHAYWQRCGHQPLSSLLSLLLRACVSEDRVDTVLHPCPHLPQGHEGDVRPPCNSKVQWVPVRRGREPGGGGGGVQATVP